MLGAALYPLIPALMNYYHITSAAGHSTRISSCPDDPTHAHMPLLSPTWPLSLTPEHRTIIEQQLRWRLEGVDIFQNWRFEKKIGK